jgi:hypothetical protein
MEHNQLAESFREHVDLSRSSYILNVYNALIERRIIKRQPNLFLQEKWSRTRSRYLLVGACDERTVLVPNSNAEMIDSSVDRGFIGAGGVFFTFDTQSCEVAVPDIVDASSGPPIATAKAGDRTSPSIEAPSIEAPSIEAPSIEAMTAKVGRASRDPSVLPSPPCSFEQPIGMPDKDNIAFKARRQCSDECRCSEALPRSLPGSRLWQAPSHTPVSQMANDGAVGICLKLLI